MNIKEFFNKNFKKGYAISENCVLVNMDSYLIYPRSDNGLHIIISVILNNKEVHYDIDWGTLDSYQDIRLRKILKLNPFETESKMSYINNSTKYKIYNIVNGWKNYNEYLKNLRNLEDEKINNDNVVF